MIRESILFVDKFGSDQPRLDDLKEKKFVVINTIETKDNLVYDKLEIINNNSIMNEWIESNKHYENIVKNLDDYILPSSINKALGSVKGLASFSFFIFKLSEKNLGNMEQKIKETKFPDKKDNDEVSINNIHKILINAIPDLIKNVDDNFQYLNYIALIHVDKNRFEKWKSCTDNFIEKRMSFGNVTKKQHNGQCPVCKKIDSLGTSSFLTTSDTAKIFLKHTTRNRPDDKEISFLICSDCVSKLNKFEKILKNHKIKILPLFIRPSEIDEEIKLIKDDLSEDKNPFGFIFDQIKTKTGKNTFNFYLFVKSAKYFFYDYIVNYKWEIGDYVDFFSKDYKEYLITRQNLANKIISILLSKGEINYFDKVKGKDNLETFMIYSMRQKIFDFVYRNQNTLTIHDIQDIILFRIETEIRNNSIGIEKKCQKSLNLSFNKHLLLNSEIDKDMILVNRIKEAKKLICSGNREFEIRDNEEWAYFAGQLAYYLVSLSKSNDKNYSLLEPFTNKTTTKLVKITIEQLFERYKHEIRINNRRFGIIASKVLSYEIDTPFIKLKIPFYVGVFDDNTMYQKKEVGE